MKTKEGIDGATVLQQQLERMLISPEEQQQMAKIAQARAKVLEANVAINKVRAEGDLSQARSLLERQMLPAVAIYNQSQSDLVGMQERLRDQSLVEGQQARETALMLGVGALALVVVVWLLLSVMVVRQITAPLDKAVELADTIAAGDLTVDVHDDRRDELGHLLRSLSTMTQRLRTVVAEVRNGVDSVSSAASQIATGNQDLSGRTEQTAANLEETAASIEELTATVSQSADTARQANQLASTAVHSAERGAAVVEQVVASMQQITSSSHKISDIIGVIDGIAFQTNILALNAAVEAARAGESMQEIVSSVRRVTDLIGEISAAASEQNDGFAQVNQAVGNLDQMTQQNAALVEESSAAALAMNEQAQRLAQVVSVFHVGQAAVVAMAKPAVMPRSAPAAAQARSVSATAAKPAAKPAMSKPTVAKAAAAAAVPSTLEAPLAKKTAAIADDDWESF